RAYLRLFRGTYSNATRARLVKFSNARASADVWCMADQLRDFELPILDELHLAELTNSARRSRDAVWTVPTTKRPPLPISLRSASSAAASSVASTASDLDACPARSLDSTGTGSAGAGSKIHTFPLLLRMTAIRQAMQRTMSQPLAWCLFDSTWSLTTMRQQLDAHPSEEALSTGSGQQQDARLTSSNGTSASPLIRPKILLETVRRTWTWRRICHRHRLQHRTARLPGTSACTTSLSRRCPHSRPCSQSSEADQWCPNVETLTDARWRRRFAIRIEILDACVGWLIQAVMPSTCSYSILFAN
uniref:CDT1 domain-containing protein n=1 Tax=Macrostomum lignano TaxID=282301 RepID=A0A1I8F9W7_9PLAT